jgi:hypothetical protein
MTLCCWETAPDIAYFLDHRGMVQLISTCGVTQPIFGVSDRLIFAPIVLEIDRPIFRPVSMRNISTFLRRSPE